MNNPTEELKARFIKTVGNLTNFTPYSDQPRRDGFDELIPDEYFKSLLNTDLAVQIGGHIFKVNPKEEKVYALPVANAGQYRDLVSENIANTNIRVFLPTIMCSTCCEIVAEWDGSVARTE